MVEKKEILKIICIVIIVVIAIVYNFMYKEDSNEEYDYSEIVTNENIEISKEEKKEMIKIHVTGQVKSPGVIELEYGSRIEDAIILSGGTTELADLSLINLAYTLQDEEKLYIPSLNENFSKEYITKENAEGILESTNSDNNSKVNINIAGISELSSLPGVGESLAKKIIAYREQNGKFKKIDELKKVNGIGDKKYESLKEYIFVK